MKLTREQLKAAIIATLDRVAVDLNCTLPMTMTVCFRPTGEADIFIDEFGDTLRHRTDHLERVIGQRSGESPQATH